MNTIFKSHSIFFLIVLAALLLPGSLLAEQNTRVDSATDQERSSSADVGEDILTRINSIQKLVKAHRLELKKTEGEARLATFLQIITYEDELRMTLDELVELIAKQEEEGLDTVALVSRAKQIIANQAKTIQQDIKSADNSLRQLNGIDQDEMPSEEIDELEQQTTRLNRYLDLLYTAAYENIERRKNLEIDFAADLKMLKTLLKERGKLLEGHVKLSMFRITFIENRIDRLSVSGVGNGIESLQSDLFQWEEKQEIIVNSLTVTLDLMDKVELDTSEYRILLIQATGNIGDHIFDTKVAIGLMKKVFDRLLDWFEEQSPVILLKIIIILLILLISKMFAALAGRLVRNAISKSNLSLSTLLQEFFVSMAYKAVMFIGLLIILSQLGVEIGPALAGLGVAGFIVGFALQETLANFASGLMILVYRPFDVGDVVEVAGITGKVKLMSLVSTTIVTFDNQRLVVPNTKIWGDVIRNVTAEKNRRVDLVFGIGYEDDIGHAEKILKDIVDSHELVLKKPEATIKLHTLGESSVDFVVRPWVHTDDYWDVYWDITRAVKARFDKEGISIPYPQRDIHMHQVSANPPPIEPPASTS